MQFHLPHFAHKATLPAPSLSVPASSADLAKQTSLGVWRGILIGLGLEVLLGLLAFVLIRMWHGA